MLAVDEEEAPERGLSFFQQRGGSSIVSQQLRMGRSSTVAKNTATTIAMRMIVRMVGACFFQFMVWGQHGAQSRCCGCTPYLERSRSLGSRHETG